MELHLAHISGHLWEFPIIRGTLHWGPSNKDPTNWGTILGSPIFGNPPIAAEWCRV